MSEYMVLCGQVHVSRSAFTTAQRARLRMKATAYDDTGEESESEYAPTVNEFFAVPDSDDELFVQLNERWTLNEFDAKRGTWRFSVPLHDDFWADLHGRDELPRRLLEFLARTKDGSSSDPVLLFWEGAGKVEQAFLLRGAEWSPLPLEELPAAPIKQLLSGELSAGLGELGASLNRNMPEDIERPATPSKPAKAKTRTRRS